MRPVGLLFATCLALPGIALAQREIGLRDAIATALQQGPVVTAARARVDAARAELVGARLLFPGNPELALDAASDNLFADEGESARGVALSQQFWAPGQRRARVSAAASGLRSLELEFDWARRTVAADVAFAYVRLGAARRKQAVIEDLAAVLQRIRTVADKGEDVGRLSSFERNRVLIESATAQGELAAARSQVAAATGDLSVLLGETVPADVVLMPLDPLPEDLLARAAAADPTTRTDVLAAAAAFEAAEAGIRVQRAERHPRPRVLLGWGREHTVFGGDAFSGLPFPSDAVRIDDKGSQARVEVSFALPVFDRNQAGIAGAIAGRALAAAERMRTTQHAVTEREVLTSQALNLASAWAGLGDAREAIAQNLEVLDRAWAAGALGLSEILLERERLLRASLLVEDVQAELLGTRLRLLALWGDLSELGVDPGPAEEAEP